MKAMYDNVTKALYGSKIIFYNYLIIAFRDDKNMYYLAVEVILS